MNYPDSKQAHDSEDEIDMIYLVRPLWHSRHLIFWGTLVVTIMSILVSFALPKVYRSEGFYQLGISITQYKKSRPLFTDPNNFQSAINRGTDFAPEVFQTIGRSEKEISEWIRPIYTHAKEDAKEFIQSSVDETNSVLGVKISYQSDTPEKARDFINFIGQYIRNSLLYISMHEYIMNNFSSVNSELIQNENSIINLEFDLLLNTNKITDMKNILTKYPDSGKIENHQQILIQDGGYHYLSPITQMVGIETKMSDQHQKINAFKRQRELLVIRQEYFIICKNELDASQKNGEMLFSMVKSAHDKVFKNKELDKDTVKEVANSLSIDLHNFESAFLNNCRFISGPTLPDDPIAPQKRKIVIITFFLSGIVFVFISLFLTWWKNYRQTIE
ncbi:MAG: Wzz/FepE/Etk N-terminal domain-containing protein [Desulfobacula sp.]|jgi:LPS O-antigen subunit length determinant protein (WzzB/FepE family)